MVARRSILFRLERVAVEENHEAAVQPSRRTAVMRRHVTSPSDENRHGFAPTVQHTRVSKNPYAAPLIQYTEQGSVAVRENPESYKGEILKGRTPEHSRGQRIVNKATRTRAISQSAF